LQHSDPLTQLARQFGQAIDWMAWLGRAVASCDFAQGA
jgi:hypothetical protein